ncbi:ATP-binding protein [Candidatus Woesearchaeota archaeon]|nr:ATP-binding protein [Candidatus Woesearchaeota archaeon]
MEEILSFLNHWWREGRVRESLAKEYKRECFNELADLLSKRQAIVICGLRRVGKSTLMYQLIQHLIENGSKPANIVYFSFDKKIGEIKEVLDAYSGITEKDYEKERIFVFLDEVYKLKDWHGKLKLLYDALPDVKFVLSGSASLKIEKEARRDLTGRAFYVEVKPLSFKEFFELKFKTKLENTKIWEEKLKSNFPIFLRRAFPEIIDFEPERVADYIKDLVLDKILFSDFPSTFERVDINLLQILTEIFLSQPGMYLNVDSLSKDLKKSKNDLLMHIRLLELGYIIRIVKNYRGSSLSASRKLRRVYPYHPSLIQGMINEVEEPKIAECFVRSHLDADFYWRKEGKEVDFVYDKMPFEVKYKDNIQRQDLNNLLEFMSTFKVKAGYLISKNKSGELRIDDKTIKILPIWHFALEKPGKGSMKQRNS